MCRAAVHRQRDRGQPSEASSAPKAVALGLGHDPECAAAYEIPRWNALRPAAIRCCGEHLSVFGARDRGLAPDTVRHQEPANAMLKCAVERRVFLVGANPTQRLSLPLVAARAIHGGNDMG